MLSIIRFRVINIQAIDTLYCSYPYMELLKTYIFLLSLVIGDNYLEDLNKISIFLLYQLLMISKLFTLYIFRNQRYLNCLSPRPLHLGCIFNRQNVHYIWAVHSTVNTSVTSGLYIQPLTRPLHLGCTFNHQHVRYIWAVYSTVNTSVTSGLYIQPLTRPLHRSCTTRPLHLGCTFNRQHVRLIWVVHSAVNTYVRYIGAVHPAVNTSVTSGLYIQPSTSSTFGLYIQPSTSPLHLGYTSSH